MTDEEIRRYAMFRVHTRPDIRIQMFTKSPIAPFETTVVLFSHNGPFRDTVQRMIMIDEQTFFAAAYLEKMIAITVERVEYEIDQAICDHAAERWDYSNHSLVKPPPGEVPIYHER